jgi:hypothetical protein
VQEIADKNSRDGVYRPQKKNQPPCARQSVVGGIASSRICRPSQASALAKRTRAGESSPPHTHRRAFARMRERNRREIAEKKKTGGCCHPEKNSSIARGMDGGGVHLRQEDVGQIGRAVAGELCRHAKETGVAREKETGGCCLPRKRKLAAPWVGPSRRDAVATAIAVGRSRARMPVTQKDQTRCSAKRREKVRGEQELGGSRRREQKNPVAFSRMEVDGLRPGHHVAMLRQVLPRRKVLPEAHNYRAG